jgi:hypothetical protein
MLSRLLSILLLLGNSIASAKPNIELIAAVRIAEAYIAEHKIQNNHRYLAQAIWIDDPTQPEKGLWSIMWLPNDMGLDGQLVVWVSSDGTIKYQDSWA